ncbi:HAD-IC family P-type ATPase, partial [Baaleninema sp.]|uniref:HAD-IC family P-type ATPase n=1 Tax=Baaleninema sp. TaxID=3101197 RepID=UPI003CFD1CF8
VLKSLRGISVALARRVVNHAEAFPEHKAEVVQRLHGEGKTVAFVGDGLNDSAALAYADVSVSFRDGSDIARETADVVLMQNDLHGLVEAIAIARHATGIIDQNTSVVTVSNLAGLAVATTVGLHPIAATLINNGSSALVGVNGLRPALGGCPLPERAIAPVPSAYSQASKNTQV